MHQQFRGQQTHENETATMTCTRKQSQLETTRETRQHTRRRPKDGISMREILLGSGTLLAYIINRVLHKPDPPCMATRSDIQLTGYNEASWR